MCPNDEGKLFGRKERHQMRRIVVVRHLIRGSETLKIKERLGMVPNVGSDQGRSKITDAPSSWELRVSCGILSRVRKSKKFKSLQGALRP